MQGITRRQSLALGAATLGATTIPLIGARAADDDVPTADVKPPEAKVPAVKAPERKRRRPAVIAPEPTLVEPPLVEPAPQPLQPELVLPTEATEESLCAPGEVLPNDVLAAEPHAEAEIASPPIEADLCPPSEFVNDGDNGAAVPVDSQRRGFAERLRDWLGRTA